MVEGRIRGAFHSLDGRNTEGLRHGLHSFDLPFETAPFTVSMLWHPRMEGDPAHRWLRGRVRIICASQQGDHA